ncbi:hypothetical protein ACN47E_007400 [Coniothyrium glycines]
MASPVLESRIEPHKKAQYSLHISDRIAHSDAAHGAYSSVKYNHKPAQTSDSRTTTLTSTSNGSYKLRLEDSNPAGGNDVYTFTGHKSALTKSYILVLDSSSQQATLEPLSSSYTFNLATRNNANISSQHPKIYPKKAKDDPTDRDEDADLFGDAAGDDEGGDPDPDNPYDFRHFLAKEKEKRGDESEYHAASSPDYRTDRTGSTVNTPQLGARNGSSVAAKPRAAETALKRRKTTTASPMVSKPKKAQPPPAVRLQRKATETNTKAKSKAAAPPASRIKSAEMVHSSDESDVDADGEVMTSPPAPAHRSPSPPPRQQSVDDDDEDAEGESDDGGLEIEVPDEKPARRGKGALAGLGLGRNLGAGFTRSPSNGPISLVSATNSVQGSPNPRSLNSRQNMRDDDEIDFGDLGADDAEGEDDEDYHDKDVDDIDIGPPARQNATNHDRKPSMPAVAAADDDEDDLEKMMMEGLAGGDSSEESEEE